MFDVFVRVEHFYSTIFVGDDEARPSDIEGEEEQRYERQLVVRRILNVVEIFFCDCATREIWVFYDEEIVFCGRQISFVCEKQIGFVVFDDFDMFFVI